jgi:3D (Asp-Asp-Asp) domain-containing protein
LIFTFNDFALSQTHRITATAYSLKGRMSNGKNTHLGTIALSRDLIKILKVKFGDEVEIIGVGRFIFRDCMPPKWRMRVDIWMPTTKQCKVFGVKKTNIRVLRNN